MRLVPIMENLCKAKPEKTVGYDIAMDAMSFPLVKMVKEPHVGVNQELT